MIPPPIDPYIDRIVNEVRRARASVIAVAPGAGKTTRLPPALQLDGPVILLQPCRALSIDVTARVASTDGPIVTSSSG